MSDFKDNNEGRWIKCADCSDAMDRPVFVTHEEIKKWEIKKNGDYQCPDCKWFEDNWVWWLTTNNLI